jgi:hypothetical protein
MTTDSGATARALTNDLPVLDLPIDRPRGSGVRHRSGLDTRGIERALADRLKEIASEEGTSPLSA